MLVCDDALIFVVPTKSIVFHQKWVSHEHLLSVICSQRMEYLATVEKEGTRRQVPVSTMRWRPPESGFIKLNCDASMQRGEWASIAGVVRTVKERWSGVSRSGAER